MRRYQLNREMAGRTMAVLLSLVLILSSSGITASAAEIPETSADFVGEEEQDASNEVLGEGCFLMLICLRKTRKSRPCGIMKI